MSSSFMPLPVAQSNGTSFHFFQTFSFLPDVRSGGQIAMLPYIIAFIALVALVERWNRNDPFRDIPGPFLARWTPLWLAYQARRGRRYLAVDALHKKYGKFVRISPNHISVADKDALPVVYGQGQAAFDKSPFYHAFIGDKPSVFSTTDRLDHAQRRRMVSQAFSYNSLQQCSNFIHDIVLTFITQLDKFSATGEETDALVWFNYLAFDVLSDLAFGEAINMVANGSDVVAVQGTNGRIKEENAIALVDEREHLAAVVGLHPSFSFLSKFIPDPFFIHGRRSSSGLVDMARRNVMKRLSSGTQRDDILGKLINARVNDENLSLDREQIDELTAEAVTLLYVSVASFVLTLAQFHHQFASIAGSDTTSNSLTAIIHLVMTHPEVHAKLVSVLEERIGDDIPEYDEVKDIPYLDATINEGLRVYATTAIGLHRSVPEGGAFCCGRFFPAGTEMSVPAWTIQHDPTIWGDPEVFRPERWLEPDSKGLRSYLLTFGKGPRACLGRNLAYIEMRIVLATVMLRYNIELKSSTLKTTEGFMHKPLEMKVKFSRREHAMA